MEQSIDNGIELVLPQEIYSPYLEVIEGVLLTRREVDIIACILSGRAVKKIASFLFISPKTVENHIRNIMQKLGCRTQGGIIDFIEKSNKFALIKRYYSNLLLQQVFQLVLNKIGKSCQPTLNCLLIHGKDQKDKLSLIRQLEQHLNQIGFKTTIEVKELEQLNAYLLNRMQTPDTFFIYSVPSPMTAENIAELKDLASNTKPQSIIYLFLEQTTSPLFSEEILRSGSIHLSEQRNYYFLFFELIKKLSPGLSIDKNLLEFKQQCNAILDPGFVKKSSELTYPTSKVKEQKKRLPSLITRKNQILFGGFCLLLFFCIALVIYKQNINPNVLNNTSQALKTVPLILAELEAGKVTSWNLPRQDYLFVGREKLLENLHTKFQSGRSMKQTKPLVISACTGLGGIGKTQLALQHAHNTKYPYNLKAWFSAENSDHLRQKYLEFAKALGYAEKTPSLESAIFYVNHLLLRYPGWLLIFDNVNSYEEIAPFIPEGGGHVIVTSRNRQWPDKFEILALDIMSEEESLNLLRILIHRPVEAQEVNESKELLKLLGYLPLAIAQAGAYIRQNQITIPDYLSLYKKHESELLLDNTIPEGSHNVPVAITWDISLAELTKKGKFKDQSLIALYILKASSYLGAEKIPQDLLLTLLKEAYPNLASPDLALSKAIGILWKYSLINTNEKGEVSIHRLLQVVLRDQHKENKDTSHDPALSSITKDWYHILFKGIYREFRKNTQLLEDDVRIKNLLPHFQTLAYHYQKLWPDSKTPELGRIYHALSFAFNLFGDRKYAVEHGKIALAIFEKHYDSHPEDVAKNLNNLGYIFMEMGEVNTAKIFLERSLNIREKLHGKNSVENVTVMSNLGRVYRELGNPKKSKELLESVLTILKKHPDEQKSFDLVLADTFSSLRDAYWDLNEVERGKNVLIEALNILEKHYGKNHPRVAKTLFSLSGAYGDSGNYKQQKILLERTLNIHEQYYGIMHPETAKTLTMLGDTYRLLGDARKAKELLENALKIREQYYGINHPEVARTLNKLGDAYSDLGDAVQARALHERTLKIREQYYGKNHPSVSKALNALSHDYGFLGDPKQQQILSTRALNIQEAYYGKNHPEIANTISSLAYAYRALGDTKQSKLLQERALKIKIEHFGMNHPEVAKTMADLGDVYGDMCEFNQKVILLEKTLKIEEAYYGSQHPLVAKILTSLGDAYRDLGDLKKAKELLESSLAIKEEHYGTQHPEVAKTLISLGETYQSLGDLPKAKKLHERTLKIREQYYKEDHFEVGQILTTLGGIYLQLGNTNEAVKILDRALVIKERFYGKNHPEVAKTLLKLVQVHIRLQKYNEAKLLGDRCYSIFLKSYGKDNFYTNKILSLVGSTDVIGAQ